MSDSTLIFSKSLIKAISLSFLCPVPACPQLFTVRDQTTLCTRSWFLPATLTGSWVALHLLSCHQDTSWLFISLCSGFGVVWGFFPTEGKEEASAAENNPSRMPQGKPGERSSVLYSAGQFFFEYLVVVSLKKMSDGRYEPKITYQFPKVFSPLFPGS